MYRAFSLVITIIVLQLRWGLVEVAAIPGCDRSAASQCGEVGLELSHATGCNWYIVLPWYDECIENATSSCSSGEIQVVWQGYRDGLEDYLRGDECNTECPNQQARLTEMIGCLVSNGGLATVAKSVMDGNAQASDTICTDTLQNIKVCFDEAGAGCPPLEDQAFTTMYPYRDSFSQCNIALPNKQPKGIDDILPMLEAGMVTPPTSTTAAPAEAGESVDDIDDSTQVALYSVIGLCALIILGAGVTTLVILWQRNKLNKLKKEEEKIRERNNYYDNYTFETRRYEKHPHRKEAEPVEDIDFDDAASEASVGPYRPSGRWWTRPDFAIGSSQRPGDRFQPWQGFRNNNF